MKWKAKKLMNTDSWFDFWDKSDPYLKFLKIRSDNSMLESYRTDVIKDNLNPSWKPLQIQGSRLHSEANSKFKYNFYLFKTIMLGLGGKWKGSVHWRNVLGCKRIENEFKLS